jgi:predicted ATPase/uncharacterized protein HemY
MWGEGVAYSAVSANLSAPPANLPAPPANLPAPPTPFLGREAELQTICAQIEDPDCRILTLVGPGGFGKTRLAVQAAAATAVHFPDGVFFVALASVSSAEYLLSTVANTINFSFTDEIPLQTQLIHHLRGQKLLLILDNFEHLMTQAYWVADLIGQTTAVQVLLTSRERLNLQGEWVFEVGGLAFPARQQTGLLPELPELALELAQFSAVRLFLQSARRVRADFHLLAADRRAVVEICRLVDGMPLAIELAATWVRVLSCAEIAEEIGRNLDFLATSWRDLPPRHRSLQAVFDYSWALLTAMEQEVLCRLAVFPGGFTRQAATAVAGASLSVLAQLVDKSLLHGGMAGDAPPVFRYEMHELLRLFAQNKLNDTPTIWVGDAVYSAPMVAARDAHAKYFLAFLQARNPQEKQPQQAVLLMEIGAEIDHVREAWQWALARGQWQLLTLAFDALFHFYDMRGWLEEGREVFGTAVARLRQLRTQTPELVDEVMWGKMLAREGQFCYRQGLYDQAQRLLEESLPIFRRLQRERETVFLLNLLGRIAYRHGAYAEAEQWCRESLSLCQNIVYAEGTIRALATLGHVAVDRGAYDRARAYYQQGLALCEQAGDEHNKARRLNDLGHVAWRLGEYGVAEQFCHQSLAIFRELDDRQGLAMVYKNLGNIAGDGGEYELAESWYRQGVALCREIGDRWGEAALLNNLGNVYWQAARYEEAQRLCTESVAVWREFGFQWGIAGTLETLGNVAIALGQYERARVVIYEALQISSAIQAPPLVLDLLVSLALLWVRWGQLAAAQRLLWFVQDHPALDQEGRVKVTAVWSELAQLGGVVVQWRGDEVTSLDALVTAVLSDMQQI